MSANVFLAPGGGDGFDRTVRSGVDLREYPDRPDALDDVETARLWRAPDGSSNRDHFERMAAGDLVLFYRDGEFIGTGRVGTTVLDEDGWAGETFWEGDPSPLVYTLTAFDPVSVPARAVNRLFDYAAGYTPPGLMRVADDRVTSDPDAIELALQRYTERNG